MYALPRGRATYALLTVFSLGALALLSYTLATAGEGELETDLSRASIPLDEVLSGGPPPQGIPAIGFRDLIGDIDATDAPTFESSAAAEEWLAADEPVLAVEIEGEARAYPLQILMWHEIVNDELGGVPIAVTYCPLCNSGLVFDRRVPLTGELVADVLAIPDTAASVDDSPPKEIEGEASVEVTFGTSGLLYQSNLLMFDSATHTLFSQLVGRGVIGVLDGVQLVRVPAQVTSLADFAEAYPTGEVLSRETGFERDYGRNPYRGYDQEDDPPMLLIGEDIDERLPPKARVVTFSVSDDIVAVPWARLEEEGVVTATVGERDVVILWQAGTRSALDAKQIADSREVGAVGVFFAEADGAEVSLAASEDGFTAPDGSVYDIFGRAVSGPAEGTSLEAIAHDNTLWFAWVAFQPDTRVLSE